MTNTIKIYQCLEEGELLTQVEKENGEQIHIKFHKDRTHPKYHRMKGIFKTQDQEIQKAIENDQRFGTKFKKV